jgi:antitoxin component of MazEF toxin-antitoxin module
MSDMARHSTRKLFLFGRYSLALLLPKRWLTELGIVAGQQVELKFDKTKKRVIVYLFGGDTAKQIRKTSTNPAQKGESVQEEGDWQEIPPV